MVRNFFFTAFRNIWRNKMFSLINIIGLSTGISAALVIFFIVKYEYSFDRFEEGKDRIYRVVLDANFGGTSGHSGAVPAPLGAAVQSEVTGVELTVPILQFPGDGTVNVSVAEDNAGKQSAFRKQEKIVFTNPQYFKLLPFRWMAGSCETSLNEPYSVVLTESRARQYFPSLVPEAVLGKTVTYNKKMHGIISGVVSDLRENTAFAGAEFISLSTARNTELKDQLMLTVWNDWMAYSSLFVKLSPNGSPQQTEDQLQRIFKKYNRDANAGSIVFRLQPLSDLHFNSTYQTFGGRTAHRPTLYGLMCIAIFLLLLGAINFINLSTAQGSRRAKEIGIRKAAGSSNGQLVRQFLCETFVVTTAATVLSLILTPVLLKAFQSFIPQGLQPDLILEPYLLLFLVLLIIVVSILAGFYPALVLSRYSPVAVLKNQHTVISGRMYSASIRKTLTVSQFVIAQVFLIATLLVGKQIKYAINKDLGFRKEAVVTFQTPFDTVYSHREVLLHEIKAMPGVELASTGFLSPADDGIALTKISWKGKEDVKADVQLRWGDSNYLKLYEIQLLAGRNVQQSDSISEFLINKTYADMLGFRSPEEALNKRLTFNGKDIPIVGVMKDFHEQSLHAAIGPLVFGGNSGSFFHIRLKRADHGGQAWSTVIKEMERAFKGMFPDADFKSQFLDDTIARQYETESKTSQILWWSTGLMIMISCLGMLGLVIYTTDRRAKEIGVRKLLGASVMTIVSILSKDFIKLVWIAFSIAVPIAWWAGRSWLQSFAYRTSADWWIFAIGGALILLFALITLGVQTVRAALANPVKSLRVE